MEAERGMKRALVVTYDPPPIPGWQEFAYQAHLKSPDEDEAIGHGRTPKEAVRDLAEARRMRAEFVLEHGGGDWGLSDVRRRLRESRGL